MIDLSTLKLISNCISKDLINFDFNGLEQQAYYDVGVDSYIPFPDLFNVIGVLDKSINLHDKIYFFSAKPGKLFAINGDEFQKLHKSSRKLDISYPLSKLKLYQDPPGLQDLNNNKM